MNKATLCAMHQTLAGRRGSYRGERTPFMTVVGWLGRGVWRVIAHGDPCEVLQGYIVTALTPTGLLGRTLGKEGFVPVPVQIRTPKWRINITMPATLSRNYIAI
ncbi:hypothetical protein E2C01_088250 [Portunus trituberculatus]|uniref:Uncharacterized protein n=1 Tax=Portunus trituberculatus TaxID=210409 RepID=A0A5B7JJC3_PORTR|nr:hypothetical protein [Portunus trituberculatus]